MALASIASTAWQDKETAALLESYFTMLEAELRGRPYVKASFNRKVQIATGRSRGSVEYKFCNVSAVLAKNGLAYVAGYQPRGHYQRSLEDHVLAHGRSFLRDLQSLRGDKMEEAESSLWSITTKLWKRTTGGTDVAAKPGDRVEADWPSAPGPAGVDAACRWFKQGLNLPSENRLLFLVGGPGAGKSHASAIVTADLVPIGTDSSAIANRTYEYATKFGHLTVVNDATIPADTSEAPLTHDITKALGQNSHFLACVNRGILVEERAEIAGNAPASLQPGLAVLDWLEGRERPDQNGSVHIRIEGVSNSGFIKSGVIYSGNSKVASICAVYVDMCSLFERYPEERPVKECVESGVNLPVEFKPQRQRLLDERTAMDLDTVPAGVLMKSIRKHFMDSADEPSDIVNPITANIKSIESDLVLSGILTIARSAEVVSAARMTYRDVWGLFARVIMGDAPEFLRNTDLQKWIIGNQPQGESPRADFEAVRRLARLRFSEALFGAGAQKDLQPKNAVLRFMQPVDPMRDVIPGYRHDASDGWASPALSAFEADALEMSPLETLIEEDKSGAMKAVFTDFDVQVDSRYRALMAVDDLTEKYRQNAVRWYSSYLTRLFAVASGIPAFRVQINMWLLARNRVGKALPDELKSMMTLIRPQRFPEVGDSTSLVPLYSSRTEPIIGQLEHPRLGVRYSNLRLETSLQGEDILLHLVEDGQRVGSLYLDFALIREALACEAGSLGITDLIDSTSPRLERIRASRLLSSRLRDAEYAVVMQQSDSQLTLEKF